MNLQETWDKWGIAIHKEPAQIENQKRAAKTDYSSIDFIDGTAVFNGDKGRKYNVSLSSCSCNSFNRGSHKPCKHMYRLASELGVLQGKKIEIKPKETYDADFLMNKLATIPIDSLQKLSKLCFRYWKNSNKEHQIRISRELAQPLLDVGICQIASEPKTANSKTIDIELSESYLEMYAKIKTKIDSFLNNIKN